MSELSGPYGWLVAGQALSEPELLAQSNLLSVFQAEDDLELEPNAPVTWTTRIASEWSKTTKAILATGQLLRDAKAALPHGEFTKMINEHLPFGARIAQILMRLASDKRITNPQNVLALPSRYSVLNELCKLSDEEFAVRLKCGDIHPAMKRSDAIGFSKKLAQSTGEGADIPFLKLSTDLLVMRSALENGQIDVRKFPQINKEIVEAMAALCALQHLVLKENDQ